MWNIYSFIPLRLKFLNSPKDIGQRNTTKLDEVNTVLWMVEIVPVPKFEIGIVKGRHKENR